MNSSPLQGYKCSEIGSGAFRHTFPRLRLTSPFSFPFRERLYIKLLMTACDFTKMTCNTSQQPKVSLYELQQDCGGALRDMFHLYEDHIDNGLPGLDRNSETYRYTCWYVFPADYVISFDHNLFLNIQQIHFTQGHLVPLLTP